MIISHKHKFIFIATPKTGTTSIESKLKIFNENLKLSDEAGDRGNPSLKHITLEGITAHCNQSLDDYLSFTFCRNPWDRHLSIYKYYKKMVTHWGDSSGQWKRVCEGYKGLVDDFDDFNEFVEGRPNFKELQTRWVTGNIDFVGKMENLQVDFNIACSKIGINEIELPHLNRSSKADYREVYNDKSIDIVTKAYEKDISALKYSYEDR
jgi:hypothetical protein